MNTTKKEKLEFYWDNNDTSQTLKRGLNKSSESDPKHGKFFIRKDEQTILLFQYLKDKLPYFILTRTIVDETERNEMFDNLTKYFNAEVI